MLSRPKAAVTGARGLIGKYVVAHLLEKGWQVRVLSRGGNAAANEPRVSNVIGGLENFDVLVELLKDVDVVFHCAAELHDESKMRDVNVIGTANLLRAIQLSKSIEYFCHLSSAGVVGPISKIRVGEDTFCQPFNEYERSKYEAEKLVMAAKLGNIKVCVLRPGNVFDADKPGLVSLALHTSLKNRMVLFYKGNEGAHLVHAKDVAAAAIFLMNENLKKPEVFFVTYDDDERNTGLGVYKLCGRIMGDLDKDKVRALPSYIPYRIRKLLKGRSLHGQVRFSERKLKDRGFLFPLGLEKAIKDVCCRRRKTS